MSSFLPRTKEKVVGVGPTPTIRGGKQEKKLPTEKKRHVLFSGGRRFGSPFLGEESRARSGVGATDGGGKDGNKSRRESTRGAFWVCVGTTRRAAALLRGPQGEKENAQTTTRRKGGRESGRKKLLWLGRMKKRGFDGQKRKRAGPGRRRALGVCAYDVCAHVGCVEGCVGLFNFMGGRGGGEGGGAFDDGPLRKRWGVRW